MAKTTGTKPVQKFRIGALAAAVWENNSENGVWFNVSFTRSYRDGDDWKESTSFGRDDLLPLAKLADQAHSWICEQQQSAQ